MILEREMTLLMKLKMERTLLLPRLAAESLMERKLKMKLALAVALALWSLSE